MTRKTFFLLIYLLSAVLPVWAEEISVQLTDAYGRPTDKVAVGQKFKVAFSVSNASGQWSLPRSFGGAEVLYGPVYQESSSVSFNGTSTTRTSSKSQIYTLLATQAGSFTIPSVSVGSNKSRPKKYTVVEGGGASGQHASGHGGAHSAAAGSSARHGDSPQFIGKGNENMFFRANVSKTNVYEQEAIVYTIKLYSTYQSIKFVGATAAPKFEGFVVEEDKVTEAQWSFEQFNGRTYMTAVVARYIIFPQKPGKLTIKGNTYTISADAYEYYHDPYFQEMAVKRPVQFNLTPNDLTVDVRELPSPRPEGFSGGVGKFSITSSLPRQEYKTNQASRITYTVTGQGNLKYIKLPDLSAVYPASLEVFSPETKVEASAGMANVTGNVVFTYSFMPMETGDFHIPSVQLVYFNPETGRYETSEARGYDISVGKGSSSDKSQTARRFNPDLQKAGNLSVPGRPLFFRGAFWLWIVVPALLFLLLMGWHVWYSRRHADEAGLRSSKAAGLARKRLRKAEACMKKGDRDGFFEEMLSALWGFLGDKLKMPVSELSRQNVMDYLDSKGVDPSASAEFIRLLDDCEFARYAPSAPGMDMKSIFDRGVDTVVDLNSKFNKAAKAKKTNDDEEDKI